MFLQGIENFPFSPLDETRLNNYLNCLKQKPANTAASPHSFLLRMFRMPKKDVCANVRNSLPMTQMKVYMIRQSWSFKISLILFFLVDYGSFLFLCKQTPAKLRYVFQRKINFIPLILTVLQYRFIARTFDLCGLLSVICKQLKFRTDFKSSVSNSLSQRHRCLSFKLSLAARSKERQLFLYAINKARYFRSTKLGQYIDTR